MLVEEIYDKLPGKSKQFEVLLYVIQHTDVDNKLFSRTYGQIERDVKVSQPTIAKVFRILQENGFIEKQGHSGWKVNVGLEKASDYTSEGFFVQRFKRGNY